MISAAKHFLGSVLKTHLTVHKKEKPHLCSVCGKSSSLLPYLHKHEKIHIGIRAHMCFECGQTFTTANCLKSHCKNKSVKFTVKN